MSPHTLESELKRVAAEADWSHVVHRCAWCGRVGNGSGDYAEVSGHGAKGEEAAVTDGMCPSCASRALATIARRRLSRERPAA